MVRETVMVEDCRNRPAGHGVWIEKLQDGDN
jgi:hypothetical protein